MDNEIWKEIEGFPNYEVSNLGQVRSYRRYTHLKTLKPIKTKKGYALIFLGGGNVFFIHKLVLSAFIGHCPDGYQTNHKNGIKNDNRLENLEWVTCRENCEHAYRTGLIPLRMGEKNLNAKLKDKEVWLIKRLLWFEVCRTDIAKIFKVTSRNIKHINAERTWAHIKFEFTEKDRELYKTQQEFPHVIRSSVNG